MVVDGNFSRKKSKNYSELDRLLSGSFRGQEVGVFNVKKIGDRKYYFVEIRHNGEVKLYRIAGSKDNTRLIRGYEERGNLVEGHVNEMKFLSHKELVVDVE